MLTCRLSDDIGELFGCVDASFFQVAGVAAVGFPWHGDGSRRYFLGFLECRQRFAPVTRRYPAYSADAGWDVFDYYLVRVGVKGFSCAD